MTLIFFTLIAVCCGASLVSARYWLVSLLLIGFLQDPARKLASGESVYFVILVGVVFASVFLSLLLNKGVARSLEPFSHWDENITKPIGLFVAVLFIQLIHSLMRYQNLTVSFIGLISYLAPFLAIMVGYFSINRIADIRRFLKIYSWAGAVVAISVLISFLGYDWQIFKEVGVGLKIYDQGTVLRSFSGIMRTGEIAAWHMATSCCFIVILSLTSERNRSIVIVVLVVLAIMLAVVLTGRRKMIMLFSLFALFYLAAYWYYRQKIDVKYFVTGISFGMVGWFAVVVLFPDGYGDTFQNYLARGSSVYSDVTNRFVGLGLDPVSWAINRVGWFGGGLGIASQGASYFNNVSIAGGSGEGGLGKITVELGLPGLFAAAWLVLSIALYINRALKLSAGRLGSTKMLTLMLGIAVFLAVNVLTFSVATQVYGDVFILLILGLLTGFLFALPKILVGSLNDSANNQTQDKLSTGVIN